MDDYIKREDALRIFCEECVRDSENKTCGVQCYGYQKMHDLPAADMRENVRGYWNKCNEIYCCSNCGKTAPYDVEADTITYWPNLNFCPSCGADMRGGGANV